MTEIQRLLTETIDDLNAREKRDIGGDVTVGDSGGIRVVVGDSVYRL